MFIAQELRKKSIAEYLLYMWQIEDIIRAMGCSLPVIRRGYISQFTNYTEEQREQEPQCEWRRKERQVRRSEEREPDQKINEREYQIRPHECRKRRFSRAVRPLAEVPREKHERLHHEHIDRDVHESEQSLFRESSAHVQR